MKHTLYIFLASFLFLSVTSSVLAQAAPAASCTGEILTDQAAAQDCANKAQTGAQALGYKAVCTVQKVGFPFTDPLTNKNYYFNTNCSIDGSTNSYSAYLLAGFNASAGSNAEVKDIPAGWNTLQTELKYEQAVKSCGTAPVYANGTSYSCGAPLAAPSGSGSGGGTSGNSGNGRNQGGGTQGGGSSGSAVAQGAANDVQQKVANIAKDMISFYKNQFDESSRASSQFSKAIASQNSQTKEGDGSNSCSALSGNLRLGNSGSKVQALTAVLTKEGFLSASQNTFDTAVFNALVSYQEKYSNDILAPAGISQGTGFFGPKTRAYMIKSGNCANVSQRSNDQIKAVLGQTRYIRIDTRETGWISWREIEVYDDTGAKITIPASAVSASATYAGDWQVPPISPQVPAYAVDGNSDTAWNAGETNPLCNKGSYIGCVGLTRSAWIKIDLGSLKNISKIRIQQNGDSKGENNEILLSNDGIDFRMVGRTTTDFKDREWIEITS